MYRSRLPLRETRYWKTREAIAVEYLSCEAAHEIILYHEIHRDKKKKNMKREIWILGDTSMSTNFWKANNNNNTKITLLLENHFLTS